MKKLIGISLLLLATGMFMACDDSATGTTDDSSSSENTNLATSSSSENVVSSSSEKANPTDIEVIDTDKLTCIDNLDGNVIKEGCSFETCYNDDSTYVVFKSGGNTFDCDATDSIGCQEAGELATYDYMECVGMISYENGISCIDLTSTIAAEGGVSDIGDCGYITCTNEAGDMVSTVINGTEYDCTLAENEMACAMGILEVMSCLGVSLSQP